MTILDNSLLHLFFTLLFLTSLGILIVSYLKRKYDYSFYGLLLGLAGFLLTVFLAVLKSDIFVLSAQIDYGANFLFSLSVLGCGAVSVSGILMYLRHRLLTDSVMQLAILFSGSIVVTTLGSTVYQSILARRVQAKKGQQGQFIKADDFKKGDADPAWSKAGSKPDSVSKQ